MQTLAVHTADPSCKAAAQVLSKQLGLPFTQAAEYLLLLTPDYLCLQHTIGKSAPLYIDFLSSKMRYRLEHLSLQREALARALGLKKQANFRIVDATAGLGRDSFIMAALGFQVTLLERSPIIYTLLQDGIKRASSDPLIAPIVKRMQLIQENAITWLPKLTEHPDIIYLDPMFPARKKSALPKKDMRIFHAIVGNDQDGDELLTTALSCATLRVVVKRPRRLAPELAGIKPTFTLLGSSSRFDVYHI